MTYTEFTLSYFHGMIFRNFLHHTKMVEGDAAGLDYIDKVSKRAVKLFFMLNGRRAFSNLCQIARTLGTVGSLWTHTCTL